MKNTKTCPKCNSQDIIHVPGTTVGTTFHNYIPAGLLPVFSSIPVTRYVCSQCGFSEEWIDSPADLEKLRQKYG